MNSEIGKSLKKINNLMKRNHPSCPKGQNHRLRGWILEFLSVSGDKDIFQKDIEAEFCIRRSTATEILNRMERDSLIERLPVAEDKRLKKIVLTENAAQFRADFLKRSSHMEEVMSAGIDEGELEIFQNVADKIFINLEKHFYNNKESKYD